MIKTPDGTLVQLEGKAAARVQGVALRKGNREFLINKKELEAIGLQVCNRKRKYTPGQLEQCRLLGEKIGMKKASDKLGIHYRSLWGYITKWNKLNGVTRGKGAAPKYTQAQKDECFWLADELIRSGKIRAAIAAFDAAGKKLGVNGYSIWFQWRVRIFTPTSIRRPVARQDQSGEPQAHSPNSEPSSSQVVLRTYRPPKSSGDANPNEATRYDEDTEGIGPHEI